MGQTFLKIEAICRKIEKKVRQNKKKKVLKNIYILKKHEEKMNLIRGFRILLIHTCQLIGLLLVMMEYYLIRTCHHEGVWLCKDISKNYINIVENCGERNQII